MTTIADLMLTDAEKTLVVEVESFKSGDGFKSWIYFANHPDPINPDNAVGTVTPSPFLAEGFVVSSALTGVTGGAAIGVGDITLAVGSAPGFGEYDLQQFQWRGRAINIRLLPRGGDWPDGVDLFKGNILDTRQARGRFTIDLVDKSRRLDRSILDAGYAGTGGAEGDADLEGDPKPVVLGAPREIPVIFLGQDTIEGGAVVERHGVNHGALTALNSIRSNGYGMSKVTAPATPGPGEWRDEGDGTITVANSIGTVLTSDAEDLTGASAHGDHFTPRELIQRLLDIAGNPATLAPASGQPAQAWHDPRVSGFVYGDANLRSVIDDVVSSIGGFWCMSPLGELCVGNIDRLNETATPVITSAEYSIDDMLEDSLEFLPGLDRVWKVHVKYDRTHRPFGKEELASGVNRLDLLREWRTRAEDEPNFFDLDGVNIEETHETWLYRELDARDVARGFLNRHGWTAKTLRFTLHRRGFDLGIGDKVKLTLPDTIATGAVDWDEHFNVIGYERDYLNEAVTLTVWG